MPYGWDPDKAETNLAKHGVAFEAIEGFDWTTALVEADTRQGYGEVRLVAYGAIGTRLYAVVFTIRRVTRLISLRKASKQEVRRYEAG